MRRIDKKIQIIYILMYSWKFTGGVTVLDLSSIWPEWKAVEKLGEGSFGRVYKCEREELGMKLTCAVKVISIPNNKAECDSVRKECRSEAEVKSYYSDIVADFSNEIRLMLMLKGAPNVVSVENFKIIEHEDGIGSDIYICMEYLTCFSEYSASHQMTEKDVIHLGKDICNALAICSEKGIIHRDIKPDNIFVDDYGSFKLGDFGVARRLEGSMSMMSKKGTYSYMAPEVFRGEKYDNRADIYSLGMVMYKLLNRNRDPFVDLNKPVVGYNERNEALERRRNGEKLPAPVDARPEIAAVILKACEHDPNNRYASVAEFRHALTVLEEGSLKDEPTVASRDYIEKTVMAREVDLSVNRNVQTGYNNNVAAANAYANDATVMVNSVPGNAGRAPTVAPTYTYNNPPVANAGYYNQQAYSGAAVQPNKKSSNSGIKWVIAAVILVLVSVAAYFVFTNIDFDKESDDVTSRSKKHTSSVSAVQNEDVYPEPEIPSYNAETDSVRMDSGVISAGYYHTVGVKSDGTVVAVGDNTDGQCNVSGWRNIVAVAAGEYHTVGLKSDGTVVAVGGNEYGQCDVSGWKDIVAVSVGYSCTAGLKSDGTVVATDKFAKDVEGWKNIVDVSVGNYHIVGLKSDGTVVTAGLNTYGQCDVESWRDIVDIAAGSSHTVGVKSDGTVVAVGYNDYGQCNVGGLKNVVAASAYFSHTAVLKSDGTVEGVGNESWCDFEGWTDIVAFSAGFCHNAGLKSDGTVVVSGYSSDGACNIDGWRNIKRPE